VNRIDFQQLASMRIEEAKVLLDQAEWSGAYYLAGYAVECALKACIAKLAKAEEYPDKEYAAKCFTHNIEKLIGLAGLKAQRDLDAPHGSERAGNWAAVKDWSELSRYQEKTQAEAEGLYDAITNAANGVFPWIVMRW
jgi:hypothetical protein